MEHLLDSATPYMIVVPCHCVEIYDEGEFDTYPSRQGWDIAALRANDFQGKTEDEALAFFQSWLYFGLLWEFFGSQPDFTLRKFLRTEGEEVKIITSQHLPGHLRYWQTEAQFQGAVEQKAAFERTKSKLRMVYDVATDFLPGFPPNTRTDYRRSRWQVAGDVALSIQILADTLQVAGFHIYNCAYDLDWGFSPMLVERMRRQGWCPRAIGTCLQGQHIQMLYYASTLGPPLYSQGHTGCDMERCAWEQIDEATYRTQHKAPCDRCVRVGPEASDLTAIYKNNDIPLFRFDTPNHRYQVVGTKLSGAYTAISHVCEY